MRTGNALRGENGFAHGGSDAPHAGAGTPFFGRRQRKGEETACHALDEGTGVTRAQETGVQNNAMKNDLHPLDTYNTL